MLYSESWRTNLPDLPPVQECRLGCDFERVKGILREHPYDVRIMLDERMLYNFRLSPFVLDEPALTGTSVLLSSWPVEKAKNN